MIAAAVLVLTFCGADAEPLPAYVPPEWLDACPVYEVYDRPPPPPAPPAPRARAAAAPNYATPDVLRWAPLVALHFPPAELDRALCVIWGESRGTPTAKNATSTAAGLWQFLRSTWNWVAGVLWGDGHGYETGLVYNAEAATEAAGWLWEHYGWSQWAAYANARCYLVPDTG